MKTGKEIIPVKVFSGTIMESEIVKSLLENAEIETYLNDVNTGAMAPWYVSYGGVGAVKVIVSSSDQDKARIIISEYKRNIDSNI
jgi:hypothetical protein